MKRYLSFLLLTLFCVTSFAYNISGTVKASEISANAELVLVGNTTLNMDADKSIKSISGDYNLTITGDKYLVINSGGHGISVAGLTIDASVSVISKKDGLNIDNDILIKKGTVTVNAGKDGIYSRHGNITIQSGHVTAECGTNCSAIYLKVGSFTMKDGFLLARGTKFGILTDTGDISLSGTVTATAAGWAVWASGALSATNGNISAKSSGPAFVAGGGKLTVNCNLEAISLGDGANAMAAKTDLNILGGTIVAESGDNASAIRSWDGHINLQDCDVTATGTKYGVYAENGNVNIAAKVSAKASGWAVTGQKITISSPYSIMLPIGGKLNANNNMIVDENGNRVTSVQIGMPALSGTVTVAAIDKWMRYTLTGMARDLQLSGVKIIPLWQISDNATDSWQDLTAESDGGYLVKADDVNKYIRVRIAAEGAEGYIYSAPKQVKKSSCYVDVVSAYLSLTDNKVYLNNPKTTQEYIIMSGKKAVSNLTESDWAKSVKPTSTSKMLLGGTANATNYVYTRVKETDNMLAGTDIPVSWIYAGTNTYLQNISLSCEGVSSGLTSDSYYYYCKVGDVIKVTASPIPSNATNYQGIYYDKWFNNTKSGTFYANQACTQTLQSGEYYKTVYFKPTVQRNNVDINAEFQKGYNDIAHDDIAINIADANGRFLITSCSAEVYICKGEKVTGQVLDVFPSKATVYGITTALTSGDGTAPVLTFQSNGTFSVDATNATKGRYYYSVSQNGVKLTGSIKVEVTNYNIEGVIIQPETVKGEPGDVFSLLAQLVPANTADDITWSSSNYSVANVTTAGVVTIASKAEPGATALVTASAGGKSATCTVKVSGEKFDLFVDGTQVTTRNMKDVLENNVFTFDGVRTLTVNGDYNTGKQLLIGNIEGLVIDVPQNTTLTSSATVINITKNTTITGKGELTLENNAGYAIIVNNNSTLSVVDTHITAKGAVSGGKSGNPALSVDASTVSVTAADSKSAISNFRGGISLYDCFIVLPSKWKFDEASGSVVDYNGSVADNVLIQSTATAVESVTTGQSNAQKILRDGNLYICLPDGKTYNVLGSEIK